MYSAYSAYYIYEFCSNIYKSSIGNIINNIIYTIVYTEFNITYIFFRFIQKYNPYLY